MGYAMRNDISEATKRLACARKVDDLIPEHREMLCQIISAEIDGSLQGAYSDIPIQVYHHPLCSGYSSTMIKRIIDQSYNHAFLSSNSQAGHFRFGSAFHAFCNEPHLFDRDYIVAPVDKRRSSEFKATKAKAGLRIVLTNKEFRAIEVMARKLFTHPDIGPMIQGPGTQYELTFFSQDSKTGLWKRCRADIKQGKNVQDIKTCLSASESSFISDAKMFLYRISASWYLEVISEVENEIHTDFWLHACEKEDPWEVAKYKVAGVSLDRAQKDIRGALDLIRSVLDDGEKAWRGYKLGVKEIVI